MDRERRDNRWRERERGVREENEREKMEKAPIRYRLKVGQQLFQSWEERGQLETKEIKRAETVPNNE